MTTMAKAMSTGKERWAWYLYDFGNSAYASVVLLAVYSAYFQGTVVGGREGSRLWGIAVGVAMLVVAVTAPILGTIADYSGAKKRFLFFYTVVACVFTSLLFFAEPGRVFIGMAFFIIAEIGYRSAQVFYDGLLPEIAAPEEMGRISGYGWAVGTAGGIICLLIVLPMVVLIKVDGTVVVRSTLVVTAVFFALSAIPLFLWLPERAKKQTLPPGDNYLTLAFKRLRKTIGTAKDFREFIKFMVAFLIFNDGVIMALDFAAIIGAVLFGMDQQDLIVFVIIVQVANTVGAYVFGLWVDRYGGKRSLVVSIVIMIAVIIWMYFNKTQTGFYLIGVVAGFAMAGTQSVSRTMVAMFSPPGKSAEFYGFFAVAGRTSSFIGPTVYGFIAAEVALWYERQGLAVELAEQSGQRLAILSIAVFFVAGLALLYFVNEEKAKHAAANPVATD